MEKKALGLTLMTGIYFYKNELPKAISIEECAIPISLAIENTFSFFTGTSSRTDAMEAAFRIAKKKQMNCSPIDIQLTLPPGKITSQSTWGTEELQDMEVLRLKRSTREYREYLIELLRNKLSQETISELEGVNARRMLGVVTENPSLLTPLIKMRNYSHIKAYLYEAHLKWDNSVVQIASIPRKHLSLLEATCRFDPRVKVTK